MAKGKKEHGRGIGKVWERVAKGNIGAADTVAGQKAFNAALATHDERVIEEAVVVQKAAEKVMPERVAFMEARSGHVYVLGAIHVPKQDSCNTDSAILKIAGRVNLIINRGAVHGDVWRTIQICADPSTSESRRVALVDFVTKVLAVGTFGIRAMKALKTNNRTGQKFYQRTIVLTKAGEGQAKGHVVILEGVPERQDNQRLRISPDPIFREFIRGEQHSQVLVIGFDEAGVDLEVRRDKQIVLELDIDPGSGDVQLSRKSATVTTLPNAGERNAKQPAVQKAAAS